MKEDFIFQQSINTTTQENEYYTVSGLEDFLDNENNPRIQDSESEKVLAKKVVRENNSVRYWIKISNNAKLYNPVSIYGEEKHSSFLDRVCRNSGNKFKEVNYRAFEFYTKFLRTKNIAWFHNAERETE